MIYQKVSTPRSGALDGETSRNSSSHSGEPPALAVVTDPVESTSPNPDLKSARDTAKRLWVEDLVADDGATLWQSPTAGPAINLAHLPVGASIVAVLRPSQLVAHPQSALLLRAFGTDVDEDIRQLHDRLTVDFESIEQLIVGFYPSANESYEACLVVHLNRPMQFDSLAQQWLSKGFQPASDSSDVFIKDQWAVGVVRQKSAANDTAENTTDRNDPVSVSTFVVASSDRVAAAISSDTANPLSGPMERLLEKTDEQRLFTLLALRSALFDDEGRQLFVGAFGKLNRPLNLFLPDEIRAVCFSAHLDDALYAEFVFEHSVDVQSNTLIEQLRQRLHDARDQALTFAAQLPPSPYWDRVRLRFDNMVGDAYRKLRFGTEYDHTVANVWLPVVAGHNLVAATELLLASGGGNEPVSSNAKPAPSDMQALLKSRFTLRDQNPPDLNILMENLQSIVRDQYPTLPFPFEIRLSNTDLKEAGITRNQRPPALDLADRSLEEILTTVLFGANPDKNAAGPTDPRCKLIWVVTRSPENDKDLILITTRDAAAKNNYPLPTPYVKQE